LIVIAQIPRKGNPAGKTSKSTLALDFRQRGREGEKQNRQEGRSHRRSDRENVHNPNERDILRMVRQP
jgi:hypothetical protein